MPPLAISSARSGLAAVALALSVFASFRAPLLAADGPLRLSQSITTAERTATGLSRLSSDQIAVLDALYRRDLVAQSAPPRADVPAPSARFSQRLTDDERRNAGLTLLTEAELTQLDACAERSGRVSVARALLAQPTFIPVSMRARIAETQAKNAAPEIHGSFTVGMGFGKGYSERFGGMTLTYENPAKNLAISFSYSESHIKGAAPYYMRDPLDEADRVPRFGPEP